MDFDETTNMPYFKGESGSYIKYDEENQLWLLKNEPDTGIVGSAPAKLDSLGTGVNLWSFNKDICYRNSLEPFNALMTTCKVFSIFFFRIFHYHNIIHKLIEKSVYMPQQWKMCRHEK